MKYIGIVLAAVIVASVALVSHPARAPERVPAGVAAGDVRVVASVDRSPTAPTAGLPAAATPPPLASQPMTATANDADAQPLNALFDGQQRDPSWAPGAEAELTALAPSGAAVRCAEFMCRIAIPLVSHTATTSPDQQAAAISRDWPTHLSYNPLTAGIEDRGGHPALVFYATKAGDAAAMPIDL